MLNKAVQWGVIETHQIPDYKLPKMVLNKIIRYLSEDENSRLFAALEAREKKNQEGRKSYNQWLIERNKEPLPEHTGYTDHLMPMIILALNTGIGMRRNEIFSLSWSNIDFEQRLITVTAENAKSKQSRHIPMNDIVQDMLLKWQSQNAETALVFPNKEGKKFNNIKSAWETLMTNAEINRFRFHDLRHDFASQLVMNGVDLYTVKELLGHSSITVTERYAHLAPQKLADAVQILGGQRR